VRSADQAADFLRGEQLGAASSAMEAEDFLRGRSKGRPKAHRVVDHAGLESMFEDGADTVHTVRQTNWPPTLGQSFAQGGEVLRLKIVEQPSLAERRHKDIARFLVLDPCPAANFAVGEQGLLMIEKRVDGVLDRNAFRIGARRAAVVEIVLLLQVGIEG